MPGEPLVARDGIHQALRDQLGREVWNVDPAFRGERVLVADAAAEGDDDHPPIRPG